MEYSEIVTTLELNKTRFGFAGQRKQKNKTCYIVTCPFEWIEHKGKENINKYNDLMSEILKVSSKSNCSTNDHSSTGVCKKPWENIFAGIGL